MILGIFVLLAIFVVVITPVEPPRPFEPPQKRAGRLGEEYGTGKISSVLRDGDTLLTNVEVSYEGKETELDNVIVNKYGVFIIEVKYYHGWLKGLEDDYRDADPSLFCHRIMMDSVCHCVTKGSLFELFYL